MRRAPEGSGAGTPDQKANSPSPRGDAGRTLAFLMMVLAFLFGAALLPLDLLGARVAGFFHTGNPVGDAGEVINRMLVTWLGLGSAAVPLGLLAGAASIGAWWSPPRRRILWILASALLLLLPLGGYLGGGGESIAGHVGEAVGAPLVDAMGRLGAWVLLIAAVVSISIAAFSFNPLEPPALAVAALSRGVARGTRRGGIAARDRWVSHAARRSAARTEKAAAKKAAAERARARRQPYGGIGGRGGGESRAGRNARLDTAAEGDSGEGDSGEGGSGAVQPGEGDADMAQPAGDQWSEAATEASAAGVTRSAAGVAARSESAPEGDDPPSDYPHPPFGLLTAPARENRFGMEQELDRLGRVLVDKLQTFKIKCEISGRTTGPVVTQYEVVPAAGVKVNRIANLDADLALAMRARSVRIVAPIPGKGAIGVEIPNPRPEIVRLREILEAPAFSSARRGLFLAMGKDLTGNAYVTDLTRMPHALIAGTTGSGKSVCLNTIITSLVYRHGPDRLRLLLIDPKMVELSAYADLPHLRHPVVTDPRDAAGVLKWAVLEMERRYALLSANGVRSLKEFNDRVEQGIELGLPEPDGPEEDEDRWRYKDGLLPWIVVVVDELADLMMSVQAEVEKPLTQLAQKARAIGIHLLVATQRPSVNVITGLIKANFPCRIAFRVASKTDSRTILDQNGADSLLGYGDMLFLPAGRSEPVRMQGAFVSTEETEALMGWYREQADTMEALKARVKSDEGDILEELRTMEGDGEGGDEGAAWGDWDGLFREAALACIHQGVGSTSLLQRRLRIGYGRAARIVDQLHDAGVLGPPDGSKPRELLVDHQGLDEICPS